MGRIRPSALIPFFLGFIASFPAAIYGQTTWSVYQSPTLVSYNHPFDAAISSPWMLHPIQHQGLSHLLKDSTRIHSPKKATIMALALPGSGQIYNRKYWKVPIVYAGLGGSIYAIGMFKNNMRVLNDSISRIYSAGKTPNPVLLEDRDNQRSRRDVAILCLAGVYVLQVLDAVVDAHFYKFNINDKIGIEWNASPVRMLAFQYQL
jgi:hypothetical protein